MNDNNRLRDLLIKTDFSHIENRLVTQGRCWGKSFMGNKVLLEYMIYDEASYIKSWDISDPQPEKDEPDWKRSVFKRDEKSSVPSKATRAKLRAKRKKSK